MRTQTLARCLGLALVLLVASACERGLLKEPSPIGPATAMFSFDLTASPNLLYANGTKRDTSLVKVVIKDGGVPVKDAVVYFSMVSGPAVFADYTWRCVAVSNESGIAAVTLLGPLMTEITASEEIAVISAEIKAASPQTYYKEVSLRILRASASPSPTGR
jgi:hypothetical protein